MSVCATRRTLLQTSHSPQLPTTVAAPATTLVFLLSCFLLPSQAREYEDEDYIAGVKGGRPGDPRARIGGAGGAAGPGGLQRSGSEMSLPAGGDARLNKRLKSQLGSKPSDAGRMDMHGRWVLCQQALGTPL